MLAFTHTTRHSNVNISFNVMIVEALLWGALLLLLWLSFKKPQGLPPGRWGLPLLGYIPLTTKSMSQQLTDLRNKHGDIYIWRMGTQLMVFLHDHNLVREAFNRPEIQDRPNWYSFRFNLEEKLGIIASNDHVWLTNRRFTLKQLRDLGMGKSKLVEAVHTQTRLMLEEFKKQAAGGKPMPVPHGLNIAITNIVWQMVAGKQFAFDDPRINEFNDMTDDLVTSIGLTAAPDFLPWLKYLIPSPILKHVFHINDMENLRDRLLQYFREEIDHHKETLDPDNPRDLIDAYLMEMEERKDQPDNTFKENDLFIVILDLFFAGKETTASSLVWLIYYLATYTEAQHKMQAEVDEVLPKGTLATLQDRARLPYTEAVIHETLRVSSLSAMGVSHAASKDTMLGGYVIPKGAVINSSNITIHHSSRYWDEPHLFKPERWVDNNGKFNTKKEGFMPFSIGKRQCVGEGLARMEMLIFSSALMQNFTITIPPGATLSLESVPRNPFFRRHIIQNLMVTARN
ncbi:hypothetical protein Pmani_004929 [Petrolisthes manimaculis]|uniref:Cytochrome P450 n=1 Tax=Petrolisthes manimaculis TaxID=1843537 RepID=A0AAE1QDQ1_9EUCA|nr:hypothetical protein Pmani_004929 [Petrolisthes manimaculis]